MKPEASWGCIVYGGSPSSGLSMPYRQARAVLSDPRFPKGLEVSPDIAKLVGVQPRPGSGSGTRSG